MVMGLGGVVMINLDDITSPDYFQMRECKKERYRNNMLSQCQFVCHHNEECLKRVGIDAEIWKEEYMFKVFNG